MLPDRQKPSAGRAGRHGSLVSFSSWEFMPHGVGCKLPEWGHFSAAQVTAGVQRPGGQLWFNGRRLGCSGPAHEDVPEPTYSEGCPAQLGRLLAPAPAG